MGKNLEEEEEENVLQQFLCKQDLNASVKSLDFDLGLEDRLEDSDLRTPT